jgi:hypothetical protein
VLIDLEPGAARIRERMAQVPDETLHAPYHFDVEVLHALRGLTLGGLIFENRSRHRRMPRYPHGPLVPRI